MEEKEKKEVEAEVEEKKEATDEKVEEKEAEAETKKDKKNKYKEKIAKLEEDYAKLHNEYLKVYAEMENTKKRLKEEAIKDRKYASQKVVGELITPIDMLTQIVNMPSDNPEVRNYQIGFQMIAKQLTDILEGEGLKAIDALGKEFDPNVMQAVETVEGEKPNIVAKVMQTGYMFKDRVLRPAMVVVTKNEEIIEEKKEEVC